MYYRPKGRHLIGMYPATFINYILVRDGGHQATQQVLKNKLLRFFRVGHRARQVAYSLSSFALVRQLVIVSIDYWKLSLKRIGILYNPLEIKCELKYFRKIDSTLI